MTAKVEVRKHKQLTGHNASIFSVVAGPSHQYFLSGAGDGWVARWDLDNPETGRLIAKVETQIFSLLYLKDQRKVVVGNMNGGVHWVDTDNPEATKNIAHHRKGVFAIERVGEHIFTAGGGGMLTRWSLADGRSLESFQLTNQSLRCIDYNAARKELAVGCSDNSIYFLDAGTLELRERWKGAHENSVFTVRYAPDGKHIFSGARDAHLKVWDRQAGRIVADHPAHWFTINDIAIHPEGHWLATGSRDKTIKIWDAQSFELLKVLETARDGGHVNSVNRLFWSPYRNYLISGSDDRSLIIWEVKSLRRSISP